MADKKSLVNIDFGGSSSIKNLPSASLAASDCLAITDESDGGKVKKGPAIGSNDGKFLRHDGSWATPSGGGTTKYRHNLTVRWSAGATVGTLTLDFNDSTQAPYTETMTVGDFLDFLEYHFGTGHSSSDYVTINASGFARNSNSGVLEPVYMLGSIIFYTNTFYITALERDEGKWVYYSEAYLYTIMGSTSGGTVEVYDRVD